MLVKTNAAEYTVTYDEFELVKGQVQARQSQYSSSKLLAGMLDSPAVLFFAKQFGMALAKGLANELFNLFFPRDQDAVLKEELKKLKDEIRQMLLEGLLEKDIEELGKRLDSILASMKNHISNVQHIYGFDIKEEKVKIEFMISTKKTFSSYPSTENIYEMLDRVKKYITTRHAREEDYPMLHVTMMDSSNYIAQVAIPIDRQLPDSGIFTSKRMLKNGNILVTQVTGGNATIDSAMEQMDLYISDHQYNNVAIPYQSLITERIVKPDTSKWVTKIYFPIR